MPGLLICVICAWRAIFQFYENREGLHHTRWIGYMCAGIIPPIISISPSRCWQSERVNFNLWPQKTQKNVFFLINVYGLAWNIYQRDILHDCVDSLPDIRMYEVHNWQMIDNDMAFFMKRTQKNDKNQLFYYLSWIFQTTIDGKKYIIYIFFRICLGLCRLWTKTFIKAFFHPANQPSQPHF